MKPAIERRRRIIPTVNTVKRKIPEKKTFQDAGELNEQVQSPKQKISSPKQNISSPKPKISSPLIAATPVLSSGLSQSSLNRPSQSKTALVSQKSPSIVQHSSLPDNTISNQCRNVSPIRTSFSPRNESKTPSNKQQVIEQVCSPSYGVKKFPEQKNQTLNKSGVRTEFIEPLPINCDKDKTVHNEMRVSEGNIDVKKTPDGKTKIFILSPAALNSMGINLNKLKHDTKELKHNRKRNVSSNKSDKKQNEAITVKAVPNSDVKKTLYNKISNTTTNKSDSQVAPNILTTGASDIVTKSSEVKQIPPGKKIEVKENILICSAPDQSVNVVKSTDMETATFIKEYLIFSPTERANNYIQGYKNITKSHNVQEYPVVETDLLSLQDDTVQNIQIIPSAINTIHSNAVSDINRNDNIEYTKEDNVDATNFDGNVSFELDELDIPSCEDDIDISHLHCDDESNIEVQDTYVEAEQYSNPQMQILTSEREDSTPTPPYANDQLANTSNCNHIESLLKGFSTSISVIQNSKDVATNHLNKCNINIYSSSKPISFNANTVYGNEESLPKNQHTDEFVQSTNDFSNSSILVPVPFHSMQENASSGLTQAVQLTKECDQFNYQDTKSSLLSFDPSSTCWTSEENVNAMENEPKYHPPIKLLNLEEQGQNFDRHDLQNSIPKSCSREQIKTNNVPVKISNQVGQISEKANNGLQVSKLSDDKNIIQKNTTDSKLSLKKIDPSQVPEDVKKLSEKLAARIPPHTIDSASVCAPTLKKIYRDTDLGEVVFNPMNHQIKQYKSPKATKASTNGEKPKETSIFFLKNSKTYQRPPPSRKNKNDSEIVPKSEHHTTIINVRQKTECYSTEKEETERNVNKVPDTSSNTDSLQNRVHILNETMAKLENEKSVIEKNIPNEKSVIESVFDVYKIDQYHKQRGGSVLNKNPLLNVENNIIDVSPENYASKINRNYVKVTPKVVSDSKVFPIISTTASEVSINDEKTQSDITSEVQTNVIQGIAADLDQVKFRSNSAIIAKRKTKIIKNKNFDNCDKALVISNSITIADRSTKISENSKESVSVIGKVQPKLKNQGNSCVGAEISPRNQFNILGNDILDNKATKHVTETPKIQTNKEKSVNIDEAQQKIINLLKMFHSSKVVSSQPVQKPEGNNEFLENMKTQIIEENPCSLQNDNNKTFSGKSATAKIITSEEDDFRKHQNKILYRASSENYDQSSNESTYFVSRSRNSIDRVNRKYETLKSTIQSQYSRENVERNDTNPDGNDFSESDEPNYETEIQEISNNSEHSSGTINSSEIQETSVVNNKSNSDIDNVLKIQVINSGFDLENNVCEFQGSPVIKNESNLDTSNTSDIQGLSALISESSLDISNVSETQGLSVVSCESNLATNNISEINTLSINKESNLDTSRISEIQGLSEINSESNLYTSNISEIQEFTAINSESSSGSSNISEIQGLSVINSESNLDTDNISEIQGLPVINTNIDTNNVPEIQEFTAINSESSLGTSNILEIKKMTISINDKTYPDCSTVSGIQRIEMSNVQVGEAEPTSIIPICNIIFTSETSDGNVGHSEDLIIEDTPSYEIIDSETNNDIELKDNKDVQIEVQQLMGANGSNFPIDRASDEQLPNVVHNKYNEESVQAVKDSSLENESEISLQSTELLVNQNNDINLEEKSSNQFMENEGNIPEDILGKDVNCKPVLNAPEEICSDNREILSDTTNTIFIPEANVSSDLNIKEKETKHDDSIHDLASNSGTENISVGKNKNKKAKRKEAAFEKKYISQRILRKKLRESTSDEEICAKSKKRKRIEAHFESSSEQISKKEKPQSNEFIKDPKKSARKRKQKSLSSDEEIPLSEIASNEKSSPDKHPKKRNTKINIEEKLDCKDVSPTLDKTKPLPSTKMPKGQVQCGVCFEIMSEKTWNKHSLNKHYYLAWIVGEPELDMKNESYVMKMLTNAKKQLNKLTCMTCNEKKASAVGYLSHINICQKTPEEIEAYKILCPLCNMKVFPSSYYYHKTKHEKESKELENSGVVSSSVEDVEDQPESSGLKTKKRKAASMAEDMFKKIGIDTITDSFHYFYTKGCTPSVNQRMRTIWSNQLSSDSKAVCLRKKCSHVEENLDSMVKHYIESCEHIVTKPFVCKICKLQTRDEESMLDHVKSKHSETNHGDADDEIKEADLSSESDNYEDNNELTDYSDESESPNKSMSVPNIKRVRKKVSTASNLSSAFKFVFDEPITSEIMRKKISSWMRILKESIFSGQNLFPKLACNEFYAVMEDEVESYLPEDRESCYISHMIQDKHQIQKIEWSKYKLFQSEIKQGIQTFWCGGSVYSADFLPCFYSNAYVAIAAGKSLDERYSQVECYSHKGLIQIWDLGPLDNKNHKCQTPAKMVLGVAHNHGVIWNLAWCPSGCDNYSPDSKGINNRMGLLAVSCSNGQAYVYAVCHPDTLPNSNNKIWRTDPVCELSISSKNSEEFTLSGTNYQATTICWSQDGKHNIIVVGYSNGVVAFFNIATKSTLLNRKMGNTQVILPFKIFQAYPNAITGVALMPRFKSNYEPPLVVSSLSGSSIWRGDQCTYSHMGSFTGVALPLLYPEVLNYSEQIQPTYMRSYIVPLALSTGSDHKWLTSEECVQVACLMNWTSTQYSAGYHGQLTRTPYKSPFLTRHRGGTKRPIQYRELCWYMYAVKLDRESVNLFEITTKNRPSNQIKAKDTTVETIESLASYKDTSRQYGIIIVDMSSPHSNATKKTFINLPSMRLWPLWEQLCLNNCVINERYSNFAISGSRAGFCRTTYVHPAAGQ